MANENDPGKINAARLTDSKSGLSVGGSKAIEQGRSRHTATLFDTLKTEAVMTAAFRLPGLGVDRITRATETKVHPGLTEGIIHAVENNNLILIYSPHDSLYNVHTVSLATKMVTDTVRLAQGNDKFPGFMMPVAGSLATGDQSHFERRAYEESMRLAKKRFLQTLPHTRSVDKEKYSTEGNRLEYIKNLLGAIKDNYGIALFAEGNMGDGQGMRYFQTEAIPFIVDRVKSRYGRDTTLISLGTSGDNVLPPHGAPTLAAWRGGLGLGTAHLVDLEIGTPFTLHPDLLELAGSKNSFFKDQFNYVLGSKAAELVREEKKGVYSHHSLLKPDEIVYLAA